MRCLSRMEDRSSLLPVRNESVFGAGEIAAIAENTFLRCALGSTIIRGVPLEAFLTGLRQALLRLADYDASGSVALQDDVLGLFCALAEQCFLNEYVFAQTAEETSCAERLRALLQQKLRDGADVPVGLVATVGAYFPLHPISNSESLLSLKWPDYAAATRGLAMATELRRPFLPTASAPSTRFVRLSMRGSYGSQQLD